MPPKSNNSYHAISTTTVDVTNQRKNQIKKIYDRYAFVPGDKKSRVALKEARLLNEGLLGHQQISFDSGPSVIHELLQNADDSHQQDKEEINITIKVVDGYFIFSHNGRHFDENDVKKICRVGDHETVGKQQDSSKTGYKGVGFKSVFVVGEQITIVSQHYKFRFDKAYVEQKENSKGLPWQVMPIWTNTTTLLELAGGKLILGELTSKEVHFIVKLSQEGIEKINKEISMLRETLENILFLRHVKQITLRKIVARSSEESSSTHSIKKARIAEASMSSTAGTEEKITITKTEEKVIIVNSQQECQWILFPFSITIPEAIKAKIVKSSDIEVPPRIKNATTTLLTFAAALDQNGHIIKTEGSVFATLPLPKLGKTGFPFHINAEFLPDTCRTHLIQNAWNLFLWKEVARSHFHFLAYLAQEQAQQSYFLRLLGPKNSKELSAYFKEEYQSGFNWGLQNIAFIPAQTAQNSSDLLLFKNSIIDPYGFFAWFNLIYSHEKKLVKNEIKEVQSLIELGALTLALTDLRYYIQQYLTEQTDLGKHREVLLFVKNLSDEKRLSLEEIKQFPLILCTDKTIVTPASGVLIWAGIMVSESLVRDLKLKFVNQDLLIDKKIIKFLEDCDIKKLDIEKFINLGLDYLGLDYICKEKVPDTNFVLEFTRYLFDLYSNDEINNQQLLWSKLLTELPVLTSQSKLLPGAQCYLADDYHPKLFLQSELPDLDIYVSPRYLREGDDTDNWRKFFIDLHVVAEISLRVIQNYKRGLAERERPYLEGYFKTYSTLGKIQEHSLSTFLDIPLCDLLLKPSYVSKYEKHFWQAIVANPKTLSDHYSTTVYYILKDSKKLAQPFLKYFLQNYPVVLDQNGQRHKITALYAPHLASAVGNFLKVAQLPVALQPEQAQTLGFVCELKLEDCLKILARLSEEKSFSLEQYVEIFRHILQHYRQNPEETKTKCQTQWEPDKLNKLPARSNKQKPINELSFVATTDNKNRADSDVILRNFSPLSPNELSQIADLFGIKCPVINELPVHSEQAVTDTNMKECLKMVLPAIAIIEARSKNNATKKVLKLLTDQFFRLEIKKVNKMSIEKFYDFRENILYYSRIIRGREQSIANELANFFGIVEKDKPTEAVMALLSFAVNTIPEEVVKFLKQNAWFEDGYYDMEEYTILWEDLCKVSTSDQTDSANTTTIANTYASQNSLAPLPKGLDLTSALVPSTAFAEATVEDQNGDNEAVIPDFSERLSLEADTEDPITTTQKTIPVHPSPRIHKPNPSKFFRPASEANAILTMNYRNHDSDELEPLQNDHHRNPHTLANDKVENSRIGAKGETFFFQEIMEKYKNKISSQDIKYKRFQGCKLTEIETGFKITKGDQIVLECVWNNKEGMGENVAYKESSKDHDFKLIKYFPQGATEVSAQTKRIFMIEVKSTTCEKQSIAIARMTYNELKAMRKIGDRYHLYRVYGVDGTAPYTIKIKDFAKRFQVAEGQLPLYDVTLKI